VVCILILCSQGAAQNLRATSGIQWIGFARSQVEHQKIGIWHDGNGYESALQGCCKFACHESPGRKALARQTATGSSM
jgi:hypothetical protein